MIWLLLVLLIVSFSPIEPVVKRIIVIVLSVALLIIVLQMVGLLGPIADLGTQRIR